MSESRDQLRVKKRLESIQELLREYEEEELKRLKTNEEKYGAVEELEKLKAAIESIIRDYRPAAINYQLFKRDCPHCSKKDPNYDIYHPSNYYTCPDCKIIWWYCSFHDCIVKEKSRIAIPHLNKIGDYGIRCKCQICQYQSQK